MKQDLSIDPPTPSASKAGVKLMRGNSQVAIASSISEQLSPD